MAPPQANNGSNRTITSFFKKSVPLQSSVLEEEIVVASQPSPASIRNASLRPKNSQDAATPTKRGSGRSAKTQSSTSPLSSSQSGISLPSRERGRHKSLLPGEVKSRRSSTNATPTKSSPRYNVNPLNGEEEITPTPDSPYRVASASPTKRVLLGSPKPKSPEQMAAPPPPISQPQFSLPAPTKAAGSSFSSSLSSVSLSSQPSISISATSSSKRVLKGGLKGVTNSESDTDDSSDEELPDVMSFVAKKKVKLSPPAETKKTPTIPGRQSTRLSNGSRQSSLSMLPMSPPRKVYKNSLKNLVAQKEKQNMSEAMIASLESELKESKKREELAKEQPQTEAGSNALLVGSGSDDDDRERIRRALARTEALKNASQYHFFANDKPIVDDVPFPTDGLPDAPWSAIFRDDFFRAQACVTGFAAELAARYPFPKEVISWFADQLVYEASEQIRDAYVEILRATSTLDHKRCIKGCKGVLSSTYNTQFDASEEDKQPWTSKSLPAGLADNLRLLAICAPAEDRESPAPLTTQDAVLALAMLNIDQLVKQDAKLTGLISSSILSMLEELSAEHFEALVPSLVDDMFGLNVSPLHRYRAIASLPANTLRAHTLRRRAALQYFSTTPAKSSSPTPDWPASILHTLETNPSFAINDQTDYTLLSALTSILDIALGAGFTPYATLHPTPPPSATKSTDLASTSSFFSRPTIAPQSPEERQHNDFVDAVVMHLKSMMARIKDSGTSHLSRTEAKHGLEGVCLRLECGVRTRARGKKSVFQAGTGGRRSVGFVMGDVVGSSAGRREEKEKRREDSGVGAEREGEEDG